MDSRGRIKIESKEDMRKRGSRRRTVPTPLLKRSLAVDLQRRSRYRVTPAKHHRGFDEQGVVTISAHFPWFVSTGRQGRSHSIPSIYDNALVLPQPRLPTHRERSTRS